VQTEIVAREELRECTILKVPHHGAALSLDPAFLEAVRPLVAIISVGEENSFGHPAEETLSLLSGTTIYRTDQNGAVEVGLDPTGLRLVTAR
jgi:competence protein ComEC